MRNLATFTIVLLLMATGGAALARDAKATPAPVAPVKPGGPLGRIAPADAYFGPFAMSPLSIRSTIGLLGREYHQRIITDHDLLHKAVATEDALRKWRAAYPADPWLAPTFFHLEQLYQAVQTAEARKHAAAVLKTVIAYYPASKEGHLSRARLAAGFPPLVAESPVVAPSPSASASPSTAILPGSTASPAPSEIPAATASSAPDSPVKSPSPK